MQEDGKPVVDAAGKPVLGSERDARQVFDRLAGCWTFWGKNHGYFKTAEDATAFHDEMCYMLAYQMAAPNSPQWFNTGLHYAYGLSGPAQGHFYVDPKLGEVVRATNAFEHPQPHACFIQSIEDDLVNENGIMDLWVREARLFKYGSGTGTNFSRLRGDGESLSGGGRSSGLMSFLKIGDRAAGAIKSGGTTRRAAKMVCLDLDHPDIEEFIDWKVVEEQKVAAMVTGSKVCAQRLNAVLKACLLVDAAGQMNRIGSEEEPGAKGCRDGGPPRHGAGSLYPPDVRICEQGYTHFVFHEYDTNWDGKAYQTVSGQNSNNSVRIPNGFFDVLERTAIGNCGAGSMARSAKRSRRATSGTKLPGRPGSAPTPARNTIRPSMNGTPVRKTAGSTPPIPVPNICSWTIRPAIWRRSTSPSFSMSTASLTWRISAMRCACGPSSWRSAC